MVSSFSDQSSGRESRMRWLVVLLALSLPALTASHVSEPLTEAELQDALLTLDDLPAGWEWRLNPDAAADRATGMAYVGDMGVTVVCDGREVSLQRVGRPDVAVD